MSKRKKDHYDSTMAGYEGVGKFYDLFADNSDIPFFLKYAKKIGSPILDLAAGTGRVSFALANAGYEVVSLERSPSMLEAARLRLKSVGDLIATRITIIEGDMTEFHLDQRFSLIIIPNSFGHALTTDAQLSALGCIHNHLDDSGFFILDLYPGALQHEHIHFKENPISLHDGTTVEREGEIHSDTLRQLMDFKLRYIIRDQNGEIIDEVKVKSPAALLYNREVNLLLHLSRFQIIEEFGDFECNPYRPDSTRRILILKKSVEE